MAPPKRCQLYVLQLLSLDQNNSDQDNCQVDKTKDITERRRHKTGNDSDQQCVYCNDCQKQHDCYVVDEERLNLSHSSIKLLLENAGVVLSGLSCVLVFHSVNSFPSSKKFFCTSEFFPDVFFVQPAKQNMLNMHILLNYMKLLIQKQHKTITVYRYNNIQNSPQMRAVLILV